MIVKIIKENRRVKRVRDLGPLFLTLFFVSLFLSLSASAAVAVELPEFVAGRITAAMSHEDLESFIEAFAARTEGFLRDTGVIQ